MNQALVRRVLDRAGYQVLLAETGNEVVQAVQSRPIGLILMDIQMPGLNGLEATRLVRQMPGGQIPIVALTAQAMKGDAERCLAAGCDAYLSKPVDPAQLVALVRKYVLPEGRRQGTRGEGPGTRGNHGPTALEPRTSGIAPSSPSGLVPPASGLPGSILIADDNADARRLLSVLLRPEGHRLLVACDGREALRIAERAPDLALILLDVMMPGLDGLEVCRRLRARETDHYVPIILATALHEGSHLAEGLAAGADDYVTKPLVQAEVLARVRAALRLKRTTDELLDARALAAVGALAVTLGHEINNPLTTVVGNLELTLQAGGLDERTHRRLQAAHVASLRIHELVQRLVNIQRVVTTQYIDSIRMLDIESSCLPAAPVPGGLPKE